MAKVTLTFTDNDEGDCDVHMQLDPPIQNVDDATPAQLAFAACVMALEKAGSLDAIEPEPAK